MGIEYNKYILFQLYELHDGEWLPMNRYKAVLVKENSVDCGYIPPEPQTCETIITYIDGTTSAATIEGEIKGFSSNTNIGEVEIGSCVTRIGQTAFYECTRLTSIYIPNSVTSIGDYAFYGCTSLSSVKIDNSVTSIGSGAFNDCTSLSSVIIPDSVTKIGFDVFNGCSGLTSIYIPNSVTSIADYAFYNCKSLTSVTYDGTNTQWNRITKGYNWKYKVPNTCIVHCTNGDISI